MGRMRQISIERVDAVDEPATGHRWVIAKRSKQADTKPEASDLVKAAFEALRKDAELDISDEAGEALTALAEAHGLEFKLEKDEESDEAPEAEAADADEEAESDAEDENDDESDESDDEADGDESDDEADDEQEGEDDLAKRVGTLEKGLELILEKLDGATVEAKVEQTKKSAPARKRRTSKQATGQDDLQGEQLKKSTSDRPSYSNVIFG